MTCKKIDECPKAKMVLDKDLVGDWQYAEVIKSVCDKCQEKEE